MATRFLLGCNLGDSPWGKRGRGAWRSFDRYVEVAVGGGPGWPLRAKHIFGLIRLVRRLGVLRLFLFFKIGQRVKNGHFCGAVNEYNI